MAKKDEEKDEKSEKQDATDIIIEKLDSLAHVLNSYLKQDASEDEEEDEEKEKKDAVEKSDAVETATEVLRERLRGSLKKEKLDAMSIDELKLAHDILQESTIGNPIRTKEREEKKDALDWDPGASMWEVKVE